MLSVSPVYTVKLPTGLRPGSGVILGIDEAGRGPVLGPMVYGVAFWSCDMDEGQNAIIAKFDDSKKLSETDRSRSFRAIQNSTDIGYVVCEISAEYLSQKMLAVPEPTSLNKIAQDCTMESVQKILNAGITVKKMFVDALGNCEMYEKLLSERFPGVDITVKPKADSLFKVVSAASICAKVSRDELLEKWVFKEQGLKVSTREWGCGYPGDEKTKQWLLDNGDRVFGFPSIVRFSWQTTKTLLEAQPDDDVQTRKRKCAQFAQISFPGEENRMGSKSLVDMFKESMNKRVHYFSSKNMQLVTDLSFPAAAAWGGLGGV